MNWNNFSDPELGPIHLHPNPRARHIICRYKEGGELHVTIPPYITRTELEKVLQELRPRLLKNKEKAKESTPIDESYRLDSPWISLSLMRTTGSHFALRQQKDSDTYTATLLVPEGTEFHTPATQEMLRKLLVEILRRRAKEVLPPLLHKLAKAHGFQYAKVSIHDSHSRWGSCSGRKNISLSLYLMLLPEELVHYVLLHELCHTVEMNHSAAFWALLDRHTENRSLKLRDTLKHYHTVL